MHICEDSEDFIDTGQQHSYKKLHFRCVWVSLVERYDSTLQLLLKYCVDEANVCGIRNDKVNVASCPTCDGTYIKTG
jgi:hypothetical protein